MPRGWALGRGPYYFLGPRPYLEAECAAHIRREHARGRPLADVLGDAYFRRVDPSILRAVLASPQLIRALGEDDACAIRGLRAELEPGIRRTESRNSN